MNIFTVTNHNSKASSTSNLELNQNKNINNITKQSLVLNPQDNLFKTPTNERINFESSINNTNFNFNPIRKTSLKKNTLFSKQNNISFDDNKNTIIQNPIIESINKNVNSHFQNNDFKKNIPHKNLNNEVFSLGIFEVPNQMNYLNQNTNLISLDASSIPNELMCEITNNNRIEINNSNHNNNALLNPVFKNPNYNLDNQANINYINNFFNNEKNSIISSNVNDNQNFNQIPNHLNNNYCPNLNEKFLNTNNFPNLGYLDIATYEMKLNLLNSLNNFSNNLNSLNNNTIDKLAMNNQIGQSFIFGNINEQNINPNHLNNQTVNMPKIFNTTNINSVENNTNNSFFFNNLYVQKGSQLGINLNESASFKTNNSNDVQNS